tara:strand:+ start:439 stop:1002 length:564 start_codon:yes stop_codon:yes gene_type:complete
MSYGKRVDAEGKAISADNEKKGPVAGEKVKGVKITSFDWAEVQGSTSSTLAKVGFTQENGSVIYMPIFEPKESVYSTIEKQEADLQRNILHIATKCMPEEQYYAELGEPSTFQEFINKAKAIIMKHSEGKTFTMKFIYGKKGYVEVPKFPNFIALSGVDEDKLITTKYDKYVFEATPSAPVAQDDVF